MRISRQSAPMKKGCTVAWPQPTCATTFGPLLAPRTNSGRYGSCLGRQHHPWIRQQLHARARTHTHTHTHTHTSPVRACLQISAKLLGPARRQVQQCFAGCQQTRHSRGLLHDLPGQHWPMARGSRRERQPGEAEHAPRFPCVGPNSSLRRLLRREVPKT